MHIDLFSIKYYDFDSNIKWEFLNAFISFTISIILSTHLNYSLLGFLSLHFTAKQ